MGKVRQLDKRMNDAGLLRLMISDPLAMNMSNTLGYLRGELKSGEKKKCVSFAKRVLEVGFIKKILLAIYNKIFRLYYEQQEHHIFMNTSIHSTFCEAI